MSALKKLASQTAIYGLSSIIGRLAAWALTPIYTSRLGLAEYGVFSDLYSFVTFFLVLLTFGMETSFFRFSADDRKDFRPYAQAVIFVTGLALGFLFLFGLGHQGFANVLGYGDRPGIVLMVVGIIFLDVVTSMPMAKLRYDERPVIFALISLASIFINIGLNLYFILIQGETKAEYVFIANLIASGFKFALLLFFSLPIAKRLQSLGKIGQKLGTISVLPERFLINKKMMRSMMGFGLYIMLAGFFGMVNQYSDVNFISRVWGSEPSEYHGILLTGKQMAGIFSANKKLAVFILLVTQAFRYAAEPFFFRQAGKDGSRIVFARVFHYFMIASLAVFLLVSSFAPEFVAIRIGGVTIIDSDFWIGLEAVPLLLFSFVLWGGYINMSIWYKLTKQVRFGILFSGVGVVVLVLLMFILIPSMGYMGAATAMVVAYTVMLVMVYRAGQRYYPIPYNIPRILIYTAIFVGSYFLNLQLGGGAMFAGAFWVKLLVCLAAIALVMGAEQFLPIQWRDIHMDKPKPKPPKPNEQARYRDRDGKENRQVRPPVHPAEEDPGES